VTALHGVIVEGYRVASGASRDCPVPGGTIAKQLPYFKERGLDLSHCFPGTLNIDISPKALAPATPRFTFRSIHWLPGCSAEDFSLSPCRVTFDTRAYDGFIYYPHPETKLAHPHAASIVEVVAPLIEGVGYGASIELAINAEEFSTL
jgi:hypothetical protein